MQDGLAVVMIAVPSQDEAGAIARALVEKGLAACVQTLPITSTYRWEGEVETSGEVLLLVKTRAELFEALEAAVVALHPYEVPEIIAVPADKAHGPYRDWLIDETRQPRI